MNKGLKEGTTFHKASAVIFEEGAVVLGKVSEAQSEGMVCVLVSEPHLSDNWCIYEFFCYASRS